MNNINKFRLGIYGEKNVSRKIYTPEISIYLPIKCFDMVHYTLLVYSSTFSLVKHFLSFHFKFLVMKIYKLC